MRRMLEVVVFFVLCTGALHAQPYTVPKDSCRCRFFQDDTLGRVLSGDSQALRVAATTGTCLEITVEDEPLRCFLDCWSNRFALNLIIQKGVAGRVSGTFKMCEPQAILRAAVEASGFEVLRRKNIFFVRIPRADTSVNPLHVTTATTWAPAYEADNNPSNAGVEDAGSAHSEYEPEAEQLSEQELYMQEQMELELLLESSRAEQAQWQAAQESSALWVPEDDGTESGGEVGESGEP